MRRSSPTLTFFGGLHTCLLPRSINHALRTPRLYAPEIETISDTMVLPVAVVSVRWGPSVWCYHIISTPDEKNTWKFLLRWYNLYWPVWIVFGAWINKTAFVQSHTMRIKAVSKCKKMQQTRQLHLQKKLPEAIAVKRRTKTHVINTDNFLVTVVCIIR
jgi:hypothetical protein